MLRLLNLFVFNVIIDIVEFKAILLVFGSLFLLYCFVFTLSEYVLLNILIPLMRF